MKREFNHRMKNRFDELGIEIPFPQTAITFGEDKKGNAVAGRIVVEDDRSATPPPDQSSGQSPGQPTAKGEARIARDRGDGDGGDGGN
jgi:small conductance mechanosensitive channel